MLNPASFANEIEECPILAEHSSICFIYW